MSSKSPISPEQISQLSSLLRPHAHTLLTPQDGERYQQSLARWSAAAVQQAGAVLIPESIEAVRVAVRFVSDHQIELAVKGGGHSTAGASSTTGGLCLDLGRSRHFTQVEVVDQLKIKVGGGATWGMVDRAGFEAGIATVGGTVSDTGVGGLTLGGGYGWLSGLLGLTIDHLLEVQLVLADGEVVRASPTEHQDLFWGMRGAGQNFGCVLEFTLQGHRYGSGPPAERIGGAPGCMAWAGILLFEVAVLEQVVQASNRLYGPDSTMAGLCAGGFAFARPPPLGGKVVVMAPVVYHGDQESGQKAFKELLDIGPLMSTVQMVEYPAINRLLDQPPGQRVSMKGASYTLPLRLAFVQQVLDHFTHFTDTLDDARGSLVLFELYDPAQVVARARNADAGFANRGLHFNGLIAPFWTGAENDRACRQWARDTAAMFQEELQRQHHKTGDGLAGGAALQGESGAVMMYGNYDQYDEKSRDIFGANYPRLQRLKAKYDPNNTFHKLFAIQPAA